MDERSTSLRADPYDVSETYPHSGNGVTQLKQEGLVGHDFLLGVDFAANNVQCIHNSLKLYSNIPLSLVTIDILRQDEREEIDKVFEDVSEIMHMNPRARVLLNLDADTFNGIPSSGTLR
ncbi:unnamed protein product [Oikopleura dioica]|uniref:Uncharacterized protein n=1 Tax=Oikopleura dioica TaxID=34765 RepID=E4Y0L1_OIKDI|nr:unnamed protein product [Oikopleura dioica]